MRRALPGAGGVFLGSLLGIVLADLIFTEMRSTVLVGAFVMPVGYFFFARALDPAVRDSRSREKDRR